MASSRTASWQRPALLAIALAGIAISVYLTVTHLSAVPLFCTVGSVVNCASVTHSAYSVIPGTSIPISVLGVVWFAVSGGLSFSPSPFARESRGGSSPSPLAGEGRGGSSPSPLAGEGRGGSSPSPLWGGSGRGLVLPQLLWAGLGVVVVLYLVFVEIVILHQICEWCTVVHLLVIATFVLTLRQFQQG
jgi:uncharacterized membrane protein